MSPLVLTLVAVLPGLGLALISRITRRDLTVPLMFGGAMLTALVGILYLPGVSHLASLVLSAGLAASSVRYLSKHVSGFLSIAYLTVGPLILLLCAVGAGLRIGRGMHETASLARLPAPPTQAPNVLLITLDTLRAADMSLYGYDRPTTPRLDALAAHGTVFDWAMPTSSWTLPSHASMFTGRWYHELSTDYEFPLDDTYPTLAEVFRDHGFATAGFVANLRYCGYGSGLNRGFIHYRDYPVSLGQIAASSKLTRTILDNFRLRYLLKNDEHLNRKRASEINAEFLSWLGERPSRPFFAFLNYFDVHEPYLPPAPYDQRFGGPRKRGRHSPLHHWLWNPAIGHAPMSQATIDEEKAAYDNAIAYLDEQLGQLFDELAARQLLESTLVIVTADHGEEFGEHDLFDHGNSLYLPSVHVPLLMLYPHSIPAGGRVETLVSLRDLPATILDVAGIANRADIPGASLARCWDAPGHASQH